MKDSSRAIGLENLPIASLAEHQSQVSVKSGYKEVPGQHHLKRIKRSEGFKVSSSSFSLKTGQQGIQGFLSTWMPNPSKSDSSGVGSFTLRGCHLPRAITINQRQEQEQKSTKAMKKMLHWTLVPGNREVMPETRALVSWIVNLRSHPRSVLLGVPLLLVPGSNATSLPSHSFRGPCNGRASP